MDRIQNLADSHWESLYGRLREDWQSWWIPPGETLKTSLIESSFKQFDNPDDYDRSERANQYAQHHTSLFDLDVFRIYFNDYSSKVYVDLHPRFALEYAGDEAKSLILVYEILKSLMLVDPRLLGEDPDGEAVVVIPQGTS